MRRSRSNRKWDETEASGSSGARRKQNKEARKFSAAWKTSDRDELRHKRKPAFGKKNEDSSYAEHCLAPSPFEGTSPFCGRRGDSSPFAGSNPFLAGESLRRKHFGWSSRERRKGTRTSSAVVPGDSSKRKRRGPSWPTAFGSLGLAAGAVATTSGTQPHTESLHVPLPEAQLNPFKDGRTCESLDLRGSQNLVPASASFLGSDLGWPREVVNPDGTAGSHLSAGRSLPLLVPQQPTQPEPAPLRARTGTPPREPVEVSSHKQQRLSYLASVDTDQQQTPEPRLRSYFQPFVPSFAADPEGPGCCAILLTLISYLLIICTMPFSICLCVKVVQEYERAVIFRLGRLLQGGAKGPGIFFIVPCIDTYRKVDLRTVSFDVPPQEILSKDSVTVAVDAVIFYRINNPEVAVTNVVNFSHSTRLLAATTLRNVLGTKSLADVLAEREAISQQMQVNLDEATDPWGVKVERVEIKDVRLPVQLQRAMAAEAEAAREARAKVIAAEGEHKASRALKEAADVINESPSALQLRYLQTLSTISAEKNSTIIFPLPIDVLSHFMEK